MAGALWLGKAGVIGWGGGTSTMSFEQFKNLVNSGGQPDFQGPYPVQQWRSMASFKAMVGEPLRMQVVGDSRYLYYRVKEGTAQVIIEGYDVQVSQDGFFVSRVNMH